MHELLEAADLDGIKVIYDDLLARIGAGKIFQEDAAKKLGKKNVYIYNWTNCEADD